MKCPKCGSELIYSSYYKNGYIGKKCENMHFVSKEELDKMEYQARLDKVLSKFEGTTNYLCYANFIVYSNGQFTIEFDYKYIKISLDTVESLIKDLGVMNE